MLPTQTDILTLQELHSYLKIPKPTLYALAQNGKIPAAKIGKHWRFRRADIDNWLQSQQWSRSGQHRERSQHQQVTDGQS